jgi:hypothetical protein
MALPPRDVHPHGMAEDAFADCSPRRPTSSARSTGTPGRCTRSSTGAPRADRFHVRGCGVDAVGHRVVHGGARFAGPALISPEVRRQIAELAPLARPHTRAALEGIDAALQTLPDVPHIACFDTAFHRTLPDEASTYALPHEWNERFGLRRFGFHGLNVEWCAERAAAIAGTAGPSTRPWASPRSRACRWPRARGRWTRASSSIFSTAASSSPSSITHSTTAPVCSASRGSEAGSARSSAPPNPATSRPASPWRSSRAASPVPSPR